MAKKNVLDALNKQVAMEEFAARSYLNLALWADHAGFEGAAKFFYAQTEEERGHMFKIIQFMLDIGGKPLVIDFKEPLPQCKSFKNLFEIGLSHEKAVSKSIHNLVDLSIKENDHATSNFLQWFVKEQVEEESQFQKILDKINILEEFGGSLYLLDKELGAEAAKK
jgi:ferritin